MLGYYYYIKSKNTNAVQKGVPVSYSVFNPFGTPKPSTQSSTITNGTDTLPNETPTPPDQNITGTSQISKFHKLTDFAVAGAVFFEDKRLLPEAQVVQQGREKAPLTTEIALPGGERKIPTKVTIATNTKNKKVIIQKKPEPKFEIVPSLFYVERVTGHIYEMYLDTKVSGKKSNSTIPSIYEAMWNGNADSVMYRYLSDDSKTINSYVASLGGSKGEFLPANIVDVSLSADKNSFFYLLKTTNGVVGNTRSFDAPKISQVFSSPFSEWLSQWVSPQKIFLTTKASASVEGSLFMINIMNNTVSKLFGGVNGLTTLADADGSRVLYSASTGAGPKLGILTVSKHTTLDLGIYGLPEKCIWGTDTITIYCAVPNRIPGSDYPDAWYQGRVSFDDHFVKINTQTNTIDEIANSATETAVDGTHLFLDKVGTSLFFINKKDSTLWSLDLH